MDIVRRAFENVRCLLPLRQTNHLFLPSWEKWWSKYSVVQAVVATEGSCFVRTTLSPLKSADVQTLNFADRDLWFHVEQKQKLRLTYKRLATRFSSFVTPWNALVIIRVISMSKRLARDQQSVQFGAGAPTARVQLLP
jgi:hypothetical protein